MSCAPLPVPMRRTDPWAAPSASFRRRDDAAIANSRSSEATARAVIVCDRRQGDAARSCTHGRGHARSGQVAVQPRSRKAARLARGSTRWHRVGPDAGEHQPGKAGARADIEQHARTDRGQQAGASRRGGARRTSRSICRRSDSAAAHSASTSALRRSSTRRCFTWNIGQIVRPHARCAATSSAVSAAGVMPRMREA